MPRVLKSYLALLLVAAWLPATSHCALATATDWIADFCEHVCDPGSHDREHDSHDDGCAAIERGDFTAAVATASAPAPVWSEIADLVRAQALHRLHAASATEPPPWATDNPDDWVPARLFAWRALPPARAPGLV